MSRVEGKGMAGWRALANGKGMMFVCLFDLLWGFLRKEITRVVRFRGR